MNRLDRLRAVRGDDDEATGAIVVIGTCLWKRIAGFARIASAP